VSAAVVVIIPVRRFEDGKTRLADVLSPAQRTQLSRLCATEVLRASSRFTRCVVSDDDDVCSWARQFGAVPVPVEVQGLNASLSAALPVIVSGHSADFVAVVHADLPLVDGLDEVISRAVIDDRPLIVTDRHGDGTNVLVARADHIEAVGFHYGPGSADRHVAEFSRIGLECAVIIHDTLSIDLDTAADLDHPLVQPVIELISRIPPPDHPDSRTS